MQSAEDAILAVPAKDLMADLKVLLAGNGEAGALLRLGAALHRVGEREAAERAFEAATTADPTVLAGWHALAALRMELGRSHAALAACNSALAIDPLNIDSLFNAAVVLEALNDIQAARHCYEKVLAQRPDHRGAMLNLPQLLVRAGLTGEAEALSRQATALYPEDPAFWFNRGELLTSLRQYPAALEAYRQADRLAPGDGRLAVGLAVSAAIAGDIADAAGRFEVIRREHPQALAQFRSPLMADKLAAFPELEPGRLAIIAGFEQLMSCDWSRRDEFVACVADVIRGVCGKPADNPDLPFLTLGLPLPGELRRQLARQAAQRIAASVKECRLVRPAARKSTCLRIGYVSGDFRPHPTSHLVSRLFGLHNRSRFEVFVYATGPGEGSQERAEVEAGADAFCDASRFDAPSLAQRIALNRIDILVDLSGYTLYARSGAFALRPAPIQISYLAYLATSGAGWIDYALLDRQVLTHDEREYWDERITYLPDSLYLCDDRLDPDDCGTRQDVGLPHDGFVFCSFNASWKIDPATLDLWARVLRSVEGGVLWLLDDAPGLQGNLRREAAARGIDPARLVFAPKLPRQEHLARYRLADVFLDALPCNAHTTAIEALAAGLPVVTLPGATVQARVAASLLKAHGMPELVAGSEDAFVALAVRLASDPAWRDTIRRKAARREGSRLFCSERRVREIERAYEMIWERYQAGLPPADFDVPPLD